MNENAKPDGGKDLPDPAAEQERRLEQRAEQWGRDLEHKINRWERRIPRPVSALLDAVCLGLFLPAAGWLLARLGWVPMPSGRMIFWICVAVFAASLAIRLFRPPPPPDNRPPQTGKESP